MANHDLDDNEQFPDIEVHIPDGLVGPVKDGIPYIAGYTIYTELRGRRPTKWVILQNINTEKFPEGILAKFCDEDQEPYLLTDETADVVLHWVTYKGYTDQNGNITLDTKGITEITYSFLRNDLEEYDGIDDGPDPLSEFEGFYIITKDDGSHPVIYDVTIKGEMAEDESQANHYVAVFSDATIKTIDWQPGEFNWIERGIGVTSHSLSVGVLIERHFGPKE